MSHTNEAFTATDVDVSVATPNELDLTDYRKEMFPMRMSLCAPPTANGVSKNTEPATLQADSALTFLSIPSDGRKDSVGVCLGDPGGQQKKPKDFVDEYMPHDHRRVAHPTSNLETLLHLLKGSLGTGILAMPLAFYHAGYAVGFVGTIVIGIICTYCIHLLVKAQYELCKRKKVPCLNYQKTAIAALGEGPKLSRSVAPYAGHIVNTFLLIYQLGTCCVYIVFVASNIKIVVDQYAEPMDVRIYMVIILLPLILINWIRNLKLLAPFSTAANIVTFIGFGITLFYIFEDGITFEGKEPVGQIQNMPLFFGTVLFALEAIGVILPLENNMKTPRSFGGSVGVLNKAMTLIIVLYVGMGFFGYLKYGSDVMGSITLNLPPDEILAQSVQIMLALAIFTSHALQCYVAIDITWNGYLEPRLGHHKYSTLFEYIVRTSLVLLTFLLAVAIPNLELFISLFGALCLSALGIAFPAIIQSATFWYSHEDKCSFYAMHLKNLALVTFAVVGLIAGTYTALAEIIKTFS